MPGRLRRRELCRAASGAAMDTMATCTKAEAQDRLPELIDRAPAGERVVITRDGRPLVELLPVEAEPGPVRPEALD